MEVSQALGDNKNTNNDNNNNNKMNDEWGSYFYMKGKFTV